MTTAMQLVLLGGGLLGLGVALLAWYFAPAQPDLGDVVRRLSFSEGRTRNAAAETAIVATETVDKVGLWATRKIPPSWWGATPTKELALLRIPLYRFYGKKVLYALAGLVIPPVLTYLFMVMGWNLPILVPTLGSIIMALVLFAMPNVDVRTDAKEARVEFSRALGAYIDLVALERAAGSGARQAMERAAEIGDSWVFQRISEELARSKWSGVGAWDALRNLSDELGLPELSDVADIMRMSQEGSQVYTSLRARSKAMRSAMLNDELTKANAAVERMSMPMSLLGVVFMAILIAPSLLRVMI